MLRELTGKWEISIPSWDRGRGVRARDESSLGPAVLWCRLSGPGIIFSCNPRSPYGKRRDKNLMPPLPPEDAASPRPRTLLSELAHKVPTGSFSQLCISTSPAAGPGLGSGVQRRSSHGPLSW